MSSEISISSTSSPSPRTTPVSTPEANSSTASVAASTGAETQRRVEQSQQPQDASQENMERLVEEMNSFATQMSRNLNFSIDDPSGHTVITVTERGTGEMIRKIPTEEFLALSRHIQDMNNLLFNGKA